MAGIGPALPPTGPKPLAKSNKDGSSGGGGHYTPQRHQRDDEGDEAEISKEALEKLAKERGEGDQSEAESKLPAHITPQAPAPAQPEANNARMEILSEIQSFNKLHEGLDSKLTARLAPIPGGSALVVEDAERGVSLKPFGEHDIFHMSFQEVRAKLQAFDRSSGSHFDGVV